ncbi:MAG: porin family protein [Bacteroidota bacterium]
MKKLIFLGALIMLGMLNINAQTRFGAKAGANFASASGDDINGVSSRTGLNIGGVINFEISEIFSIQPEVTYSMRGWDDGNFKIKLDYVDVPIMGDVEVIDGLSLQGGPLLGVNLSATVESNGNEADIEEISTLNVGAAIGAQYELPFGLFFTIRYDIAFNDAIDNNFDAKNNNLGVSAGFFFN